MWETKANMPLGNVRADGRILEQVNLEKIHFLGVVC